MKILRDGDLNLCRTYYKFHCYRCGCIFVADNTEYKRSDDIGTFYAVTCPYCDHKIIKDESACDRCNQEGVEI